MKWSQNMPLSRAEMKRLPLGFTATSFGMSGQKLKQLFRTSQYSHTNRRVTNGRTIQYLPIYLLNDKLEKVLNFKGLPIVKRFLAIWHRKTTKKKK